mmetsp:Transcript_7863/g.14922  ORF Transcript_7863/g.14922 Transcript_7863/m.14922 type:complete len:206 (+) Transcript_7863:253-870(+)
MLLAWACSSSSSPRDWVSSRTRTRSNHASLNPRNPPPFSFTCTAPTLGRCCFSSATFASSFAAAEAAEAAAASLSLPSAAASEFAATALVDAAASSLSSILPPPHPPLPPLPLLPLPPLLPDEGSESNAITLGCGRGGLSSSSSFPRVTPSAVSAPPPAPTAYCSWRTLWASSRSSAKKLGAGGSSSCSSCSGSSCPSPCSPLAC